FGLELDDRLIRRFDLRARRGPAAGHVADREAHAVLAPDPEIAIEIAVAIERSAAMLEPALDGDELRAIGPDDDRARVVVDLGASREEHEEKKALHGKSALSGA